MAVTLDLFARYYSSPSASTYPTSGTGYYSVNLELNEVLTINWPSRGVYGVGSPSTGETAVFIQMFKSYTNTSNAVYPYLVSDETSIPGTATFSFDQEFTGSIFIGFKDSIETDAFHFRIRIDITAQAFQPDTDITLTVGGDSTAPIYHTTGGSTHPSVSASGCGADTIYWITTSTGITGNMVGQEVGRTYNTNATRTFYGPTGGGNTSPITDMPAVGASRNYYIYASDSLGNNAAYTGDTYRISRPDTGITLTPSKTNPNVGEDVTVNVTGDTGGTQYRLYTSNIPRWVSTYNGGASNLEDFAILYNENELPPAGSTYTYFTEARIPFTSGGTNQWIFTGDSFNITTSSITGPNAFNFTDVSNANPGATYQSSVALAGITGGTVSASVTSSNGTGRISLNGTTWTTSLSGITNETLYVQLQASSNFSSTTYADVTVNGESDRFNVTTVASSGGTTIPDVPTTDHGLEIFGPNGTSRVFSPSYRFGNTKGVISHFLDAQETEVVTVPGASGISSYIVLVVLDAQGVIEITKNNTQYTVKNTSTNPFEPVAAATLPILIG